jgi:hypothetical protein
MMAVQVGKAVLKRIRQHALYVPATGSQEFNQFPLDVQFEFVFVHLTTLLYLFGYSFVVFKSDCH